MATALYITVKDIKRYSALSGNIDEDKIIQFTEIAQDIHIENYLGTKLHERLLAGIIANDLTADEVSLLDKYVKPMTIHWSLVEFLSSAPYTISNQGAYKQLPENAETMTTDEVNFMIKKARERAQHYTDRFINFMCYNRETFPLYDQNEDEDKRPSRNAVYGGWVLETRKPEDYEYCETRKIS